MCNDLARRCTSSNSPSRLYGVLFCTSTLPIPSFSCLTWLTSKLLSYATQLSTPLTRAELPPPRHTRTSSLVSLQPTQVNNLTTNMSDRRSDSLDRPIGELWVELSRDEKKKICDALIDRNKPDVVQEFASLVRFTRGYLQQRPNGSLPPSNDTPSVPARTIRRSRRSHNRVEKRKNEKAPVNKASWATRKAREATFNTPAGRIVGPPMSPSPPSSSSSESDSGVEYIKVGDTGIVLQRVDDPRPSATLAPANNQRRH